MRILCLDVGSGTQDVLLYDPDQELSNCPKFVLPAPAVRVAARIRELARSNRPIYLYGTNMGGGFGRAVEEHVRAGGRVAAHPDAACSLHDDPARVEAMGVAILDHCQPGHSALYLSDFDPGFWRGFLAQAGLEYPELVMASAQDHGFHPEGNRKGRFRLWERFLLEADGRPEALLYETVPPELTRLAALQACIGGGPVADTGAAAVLGALFDPRIMRESQERGVCVLNLGNSHAVAFLVYAGRIFGVYEHHTGMLDAEKLMAHLDLFRQGRLANGVVFEDGGHGCLNLDIPAPAGGFKGIHVLGPKREMLAGREVHFPCPGGDVMLAGCFGLLKGYFLRQAAHGGGLQ